MAVAVNRTYGYERPEVDAVYRSIAANPALGIIAGGGDSHGRETSQKMEATLGDGDFGGLRLYAGGHFCQGGMTAQRYENSQFFNNMLASNSNICLILVGGNDFDGNPPRHVLDVADSIFNMYRRLTDEGHKIVYFIENPKRFTVRSEGMTYVKYEQSRYRLTRLLRKALKNRYINLPSPCFNIENFKHQGRDIVHLKDEFYRQISVCAISHVYKDIMAQKSLPSHTHPTTMIPEDRWVLEAAGNNW